ncbi:TfpX/TfpZ family type IV pilin accessory protein [Cellvibrio sp. OA-2007]|uniref:TfpX/TfpZ family type IV pilin accessory protein n=1 Tax=Cellvibrio sp. OA-2007 TaxID=529823 RepID=UPI0007867DC1|nr:TfpX/TfpZ family type IV pilin accessory protein [Cellvibrio sp. OA-2007]
MKFRLLCFASHLAVSFAIALCALLMVFSFWYPAPLDKALGVVSIFLLLLSIDVIVGPLLTLLVAKQGKKTLKMDLLIIGAIQFLAFAYGLHTVAQGRPVWLIYDAGRFEAVQAYEAVLNSNVAPESEAFGLGLTGPVWGAVANAVPPSVAKGDAYYRAEFLQPYDKKVAENVALHSLPLEILNRFNDSAKVDAILKAYPEANGFVPMAAKQKSLSVLINKDGGRLIAIVDLSPW